MSSLKYKKKIEIEIIAEMAAYVTTVARKISNDRPENQNIDHCVQQTMNLLNSCL